MDGDGSVRRPTGALARFDAWIVALNKGLIALFLAIMVTLVFINVVMRYIFGLSLDWVEEVTRYMMIWLVYLAAGLALRNGNHVAVTLLMDGLPDALRRAARALVLAIIVGFMAVIAWYGWRYAMFAWNRTTPILSLSLGTLYLAIPAGAVLVIVHALIDWKAQTALADPAGESDTPVRDAA